MNSNTSYNRIVSAALSETKSKFQLAEALALDIPPRHRGPTGEDEQSVTAYLETARQEIIKAGGESRSVNRLRDYRVTALWVSSGATTNFLWVPGSSFTAHDEARRAGKSYEDFATNPKLARATRQDEGKASKDGPPATIVRNWTPEQQAEAVDSIVSQGDPEVLARAQQSVSNARAQHLQRQRTDDPDEPGWNDVPQTASSGLVELVARFSTVAKLTGEIQDLLVGDSLDDMSRDMAADRLLKFAGVFQAMGEVARDRDVSRWGTADDEALRDLLHGGEH